MGPNADTASPGSERALSLAFRYLNRRERTRQEVRDYLAGKDLGAADIEQVITELAAQGYLDDTRFARVFAEDKRELEGWGRDRIARALHGRGLDRDLIEAALASDGHEAECERALELLRRRYPSLEDDPRERERALGFLLRKGYESELALDVIRAHARG